MESVGKVLKKLYESLYHSIPTISKLPGAGSDRLYFRLTSSNNPSVIGVVGNDLKENRCFVELSRVFRESGLAVPEIFCHTENYGAYLEEDLGDRSLLPLLHGEDKEKYAQRALSDLVGFQCIDPSLWKDKVFCKPFSCRQIMWDLNYFKYDFLKPAGMVIDEDALEEDFINLSNHLLETDGNPWGFMYRDFQSRNVLVMGEKYYYIDYQGGRFGPLIYDAVSFLWQAKAGFSPKQRETLMEHYLSCLQLKRTFSLDKAYKIVGIFALFRTLQVLGAYGFRGLIEKKSHFIESIPAAIENLRELNEKGVLKDFPELSRVARELVKSRFAEKHSKGSLTVKVFSFSYKKGYPEDLTGNGGGFMFDCRGMHNPGRYEEYKKLTGNDRPVIDFLLERGEVTDFVDKAYEIVAPVIERYSKRGFSSLQVGFGCTGGQHRSVYCAEQFAKKVATQFTEVKVELNHREQGIKKILLQNT